MEDKKISTGAKVGYFFLALVPFVIYWILQFGVTILFMLPRISEVMDSLQSGDNEKYMQIVTEISPPATFAMHIMMALVFGLWYFFGRSKNTEPKFRFRPKILLVTFVLALSLSVMSNTTALIQQRFFPEVIEKYEDMVEISGMGTNFLMLISASCLAPISEELLCRGITLMYFRKSVPFWLANTIQALIFGIMHMNWVQGTYAFLIGLILGYAVKKYNSIIPSMMIHFFVNTIASTITAVLFAFIPANIACIAVMIIISLMAVIPSFIMMKNDSV
ncbi:MAG: type II CAAX endopeptidase family protein [Ruminococcus sp.]|nr:type II CAAX endopeptidase family protein [Oscillospiraceae bacterium]MDY4413001.1 type II CAAX endopeptidase family protein [Ruminococcus sp.]